MTDRAALTENLYKSVRKHIPEGSCLLEHLLQLLLNEINEEQEELIFDFAVWICTIQKTFYNTSNTVSIEIICIKMDKN